MDLNYNMMEFKLIHNLTKGGESHPLDLLNR